MSQVKTKVVAFRVSEQDFNTLAELANRLFQMGQVKSQNPNLLAKEYIVWSCWVVSVQPLHFHHDIRKCKRLRTSAWNG